MTLPYRPNVGAALFDRRGLVFVARRATNIKPRRSNSTAPTLGR